MTNRTVQLARFLLVLTVSPALGCGREIESPRRVLFVGLDGADWEFLDPLVASGDLPNLRRLLESGASGILETEHPPLSPLLWTTMMTGRGPLEHGILDFTRFHPTGGARELITSDERRVPALWNMAALAGATASVIGLWATHPAESSGGLTVSDRVFLERRLDPGAVAPAHRADGVALALAAAERAIGLDEVRRLLPWLLAADYDRWCHEFESRPYAHPVPGLQRLLVDLDLVAELAATSWHEDRPRLLIAYHEGTDAVGHIFAPYAAPRLPHISDEDFARYSTVPVEFFRRVDALLGRYAQLASDQDALLVLASDHGFRWTSDRPAQGSSLAGATAALWHRDSGIFLLWDPRAPRSPTPPPSRPRAGIRRLAATLLALADLPAAAGIAGPPLPGAALAASSEAPRDYLAEFRAVDRPRPPAAASGAESLAQLRALGYIGATTGREGRRGTRTAGSFNNEGLIRRAAGDLNGAVGAFQAALELAPDYASAAWNLSELLESAGREPARSDALLLAAMRSGLPAGGERIAARLRSVLERGGAALQRSDCAAARIDFERAAALDAANALAQAGLGTALLCQGDVPAARAALRRSLALDPNQPQVRQTLEAIASP